VRRDPGRTDEPVTASRQGLDPTVAARRLAEHPAQGRDLDHEVAVFDRKARPGGVHQRLLGDRGTGSLHKHPQHHDGASAQGDGLGTAKQHLRLTIETERTDSMGCNHQEDLSPIWNNLGNNS